MLATKISFINEMANLCEEVGPDVTDQKPFNAELSQRRAEAATDLKKETSPHCQEPEHLPAGQQLILCGLSEKEFGFFTAAALRRRRSES